jgi:co-chaperonin GroES (HSP10)
MADTFKIKKPQAVFRRNLRRAPAHPRGDRILVREMPAESVSEGGIHKAEKAIERLFGGWIVSAGDKALDVMYDGGDEIGDMILYAKYAGVVNEWKHIVGPDDPKCAHDGNQLRVAPPNAGFAGFRDRSKESAADRRDRDERERKWSHVEGGPTENVVLQECVCGTLFVNERVIVMSVDDIMLNIDAQERIEAGEMTIVRGEDPDGRTCHVIRRNEKQKNKEAA